MREQLQLTPVRRLSATSELARNAQGQEFLCIDNEHASAVIALFGGHVLHFQPTGKAPLIWLSQRAVLDGSKPIRGGIPICWPWFGPAPERVGTDKPAHGFARTRPWSLTGVSEGQSGTLVHLSLYSDDSTRAQWEHDFELDLDVLVGESLSLVLTTRNTGQQPLTYNAALHTYLAVESLEGLQVDGLGPRYIDKLDGSQEKQQLGPLPVDRAMDRIYLHADTCIRVRESEREIQVINGNHDSVVVWNPWAEGAKGMADMDDDGYKTMLCVEAAITGSAGVTVAPDDEHCLSCVISA